MVWKKKFPKPSIKGPFEKDYKIIIDSIDFAIIDGQLRSGVHLSLTPLNQDDYGASGSIGLRQYPLNLEGFRIEICKYKQVGENCLRQEEFEGRLREHNLKLARLKKTDLQQNTLKRTPVRKTFYDRQNITHKLKLVGGDLVSEDDFKNYLTPPTPTKQLYKYSETQTFCYLWRADKFFDTVAIAKTPIPLISQGWNAIPPRERQKAYDELSKYDFQKIWVHRYEALGAKPEKDAVLRLKDELRLNLPVYWRSWSKLYGHEKEGAFRQLQARRRYLDKGQIPDHEVVGKSKDSAIDVETPSQPETPNLVIGARVPSFPGHSLLRPQLDRPILPKPPGQSEANHGQENTHSSSAIQSIVPCDEFSTTTSLENDRGAATAHMPKSKPTNAIATGLPSHICSPSYCAPQSQSSPPSTTISSSNAYLPTLGEATMVQSNRKSTPPTKNKLPNSASGLSTSSKIKSEYPKAPKRPTEYVDFTCERPRCKKFKQAFSFNTKIKEECKKAPKRPAEFVDFTRNKRQATVVDASSPAPIVKSEPIPADVFTPQKADTIKTNTAGITNEVPPKQNNLPKKSLDTGSDDASSDMEKGSTTERYVTAPTSQPTGASSSNSTQPHIPSSLANTPPAPSSDPIATVSIPIDVEAYTPSPAYLSLIMKSESEANTLRIKTGLYPKDNKEMLRVPVHDGSVNDEELKRLEEEAQRKEIELMDAVKVAEARKQFKRGAKKD